MRLDAKQLRATKPDEETLKKIKRRPIWFVLDNVLDTYNIGGIFRLAEAVGVSGIMLCGGSETPPSSRIHKAAVGTEEWVPWKYFATAVEAISALRKEQEGCKVIAVEQDGRAVPLTELSKLSSDEKLVFVVGHETYGVSKEALDASDVIVEIPMWGVNKSLNVIVSTAIAVYRLI